MSLEGNNGIPNGYIQQFLINIDTDLSTTSSIGGSTGKENIPFAKKKKDRAIQETENSK